MTQTKAYRQREWEPICSSDTEISLSSWAASYEASGYETELRHDKDGRVRLYVR